MYVYIYIYSEHLEIYSDMMWGIQYTHTQRNIKIGTRLRYVALEEICFHANRTTAFWGIITGVGKYIFWGILDITFKYLLEFITPIVG